MYLPICIPSFIPVTPSTFLIIYLFHYLRYNLDTHKNTFPVTQTYTRYLQVAFFILLDSIKRKAEEISSLLISHSTQILLHVSTRPVIIFLPQQHQSFHPNNNKPQSITSLKASLGEEGEGLSPWKKMLPTIISCIFFSFPSHGIVSNFVPSQVSCRRGGGGASGR